MHRIGAEKNQSGERGTKASIDLIEVYINGLSYGINIAKVLRVIARSECSITPVANSHQSFAGLIHIDDRPVPAIDLSHLLGSRQMEAHQQERRLLIVLEFNGRVSAYLIDGINKIHRTAASELKPTGATGGSKNSYVNGMVRVDGQVIQFLDIEHILQELIPDENEDSFEFPVEPQLLDNRRKCELIVVEDSPLIRRRTHAGLQAAGFIKIQLLESGLQALNYMKKLCEAPTPTSRLQMIVTDVEMPEMDGITLCQTLKTTLPPPLRYRVIIYSSLINPLMRRRGEQAEADGIVGKPDLNGLVARIDTLIGAEDFPAA